MTTRELRERSFGKGGFDQLQANKRAGIGVGEAPYVPGLANYKPMETFKSGRSRTDPTRIAEKMARGNARPGEVAAASLMMKAQEFEAEMPVRQANADQANFSSSILADPAIQDILRKRMVDALGPQAPVAEEPATAPGSAGIMPLSSGMVGPPAPVMPRKNPAVIGARAEGGEMEMEDDGGEEDAYLVGEEGPEMVIKRDDGSMFVLPADVTKKIMSGISMEDSEENEDAMASAMQRMGMEPKMCGGKMGGHKMKPRMNGGAMMAKETGRIDPGTSRTKTRKNVLFDAMKRLI